MRKILGAWVFVVAAGLAIGALGALGNQIYMGGPGGAAWRTASGDWTINNAGVNLIGNSAITTVKINNAAVTYAKIQNVGASSLLGNPTGSPAAASEITLGAGLSFSGSVLNATGGSGTVTSITCNSGLTGGTITTTGTCALDTTHANTWSGVQTFDNGDMQLAGSSSGASTLEAPATGGGTVTFMAGNDTVAGLGTVQTFSAAQTFGEVHGATYTPTLTSNNYTAQSSDCGKTLLLPTGTTPTLTLPNLNAACTIAVVQETSAQYTIQAASGGSVVSVNSYTKTKAQHAVLFLTITAPSATAAEWTLAGDGA